MSGALKKIPLGKFFPDGFDKTNPKDMMQLTVLIQEKAAKNHEYEGYSVYSVDPNNRYAIIAPMDMDSADLNDGTIGLKLSASECSGPAAQKHLVDDLEHQQKYEGYSVVDFVRISSKECLVLMQQLDEKTTAARQIFAANVFKIQPWNLRISRTPENGWRLKLKEGVVTYQASAHDKKMQEAVESIGKKGWFFKANPETGVIMVYPGTPPTFPKVISLPKELWDKPDMRHIYFGMKLPDKGRETGDWACIDFKESPGLIVAGKSGNGKSVIINNIIYSALVAGCDLALCDSILKRNDFKWCRSYVIDKGYGCDSEESCCAVLQHIMNLCSSRAMMIERMGKSNWFELDQQTKDENHAILLACDEIAQWASPVTLPGLDKDNPDQIAAKYEKALHAKSFILLRKISQIARASGIFFLYAAQTPSAPNGLDPSVRNNLSPILPGNAADNIREAVFTNKDCPRLPANLMEEGVAIGCGVAELPNQLPFVYKGLYEEDKEKGLTYPDILKARIERIRPPQGDDNSGHLSWDDILNLVPAVAEKPDDGSMYGGKDDPGDGFPTDGFGEDGRDVADRDAPLKGAAVAAHASKLIEAGVDAKHVSALDSLRTVARLSAQEGM